MSAPKKMPSTISAIYFMHEDLHEFEAKCDLGDFRTITGSLYPHKEHAKDCVKYVPEALVRAARAEVYEDCAYHLSQLAETSGGTGRAEADFKAMAKGLREEGGDRES